MSFNMHCPFQSLSRAIYSALFIDLDSISYLGNRYTKGNLVADKPCVRRPEYRDLLSIDMFQMSFGHGSGLFGGMGTASCCTYHIIVIQAVTLETCIYQEGNLVYKIQRPNDSFREDLAKKHLKGKSSYKSYES